MIALTREELDDNDSEEALNIIHFATNLEHCGDVIDKSLMELANKKAGHSDQLSKEGLEEIEAFYNQVLSNLKQAQAVFLTHDKDLAHRLLETKAVLKQAEQVSAQKHLERLKTGLPQTIATSDIHADILRDYRRINSYIVSVTDPILKKLDVFKV